MDLTSIRKSYRRYASVYDWVFGAVFALSLIHISEPTRPY